MTWDQPTRQAWDLVCRHGDGFALGSTMAALAGRGVIDLLVRRRRVSLAEIVRQYRGNPGYLHVGLRLLACQGWLECGGEPGTPEMVFALTSRGRATANLAPAYARAAAFLPGAARLAEDFAALAASPDAELQRLLELAERDWDLPRSGVDPAVREQVLTHLDGHLVVPVMSLLAAAGGLPAPGDWTFAVLRRQGWATAKDGLVVLTPPGRLATSLARQHWYAMSYLATFRQVPELLFGDPRLARRRTAGGAETHIDRRLDIRFSGEVFAHSCRQPFLEIALPLFNRPLSEQPAAVVDTGSGDGTLLRVFYEAVREQTLRGTNLQSHPLTVVAVEPNALARLSSARTLAAAGVPHHAIDGDVTRPEELAWRLAALGLDPEDVLHVSKSVIHNRTYEEPAAAAADKACSQAAFAAPDGSLIANARVEQNLVEHLRRWGRWGRRHGLLVVEAHTLAPERAAQLCGRSLATLLDATHGYSNQLPVEPEVFALCAHRAGLATRAHREVGREITGHTVLTLDHFAVA